MDHKALSVYYIRPKSLNAFKLIKSSSHADLMYKEFGSDVGNDVKDDIK